MRLMLTGVTLPVAVPSIATWAPAGNELILREAFCAAAGCAMRTRPNAMITQVRINDRAAVIATPCGERQPIATVHPRLYTKATIAAAVNRVRERPSPARMQPRADRR